MTVPERRRHVRVPCDAPLLVSVEAPVRGQGRNLVGRIRNVAEGGLHVLLPELLPRGTRVTLIHLPPEEAPDVPAVSVEAQVAWAEPTPDALRLYRHGVSFLGSASRLIAALQGR
jgi:hypothetical protein